jgi:hypothetical protein
MMLLPNTTLTDIACAGQALLPATGELLIVGGDRTIDGQRNYANNDVNLYDPATNTLKRQAQSMAFKRWYATAVTTASGEQVVLGGMLDRTFVPAVVWAAATPEVYSGGSWRTLGGAASDAAFSVTNEGWYYPRAWLAPDNRIFMLGHSGQTFRISTDGSGAIEQLAATAPPSLSSLPSVMYAPGKILSVRTDRGAVTVDLNGGTPAVAKTGALSWHRAYGNATLLADGKVWVNGGSNTGNDLVGAAYHSETWDPASGRWAQMASATQARLYHSASVLLPDATVLTGGGGAPGPVRNLNAEIYYPPYLFRGDGSGEFAARPTITSAPATALGWDQAFQIQMGDVAPVSRVTLVRVGTVTHAFNNDQRFIEMPYTQSGAQIELRTPAQRTTAPPGFYLLFAFDANGVPSTARTIRLL